jgi:hypothetical protein
VLKVPHHINGLGEKQMDLLFFRGFADAGAAQCAVLLNTSPIGTLIICYKLIQPALIPICAVVARTELRCIRIRYERSLGLEKQFACPTPNICGSNESHKHQDCQCCGGSQNGGSHPPLPPFPFLQRPARLSHLTLRRVEKKNWILLFFILDKRDHNKLKPNKRDQGTRCPPESSRSRSTTRQA